MKINLLFVVTVLCMGISSGMASAQWTPKANALKKRSEVTSVVYNGKLYAFLGFADSSLNIEPSAEMYDPAVNTWTLLNGLPANKAVTHQGVVMVDDKVWHIGGRVGNDPGPLTSEVWIYNITTNSWSQGPGLVDPATGDPLKWGAGGAVLLGRTIHIYGGFMINACNNDQGKYHLTLNVDEWLANPSTTAPWKNELAPMPVNRNHVGSAVLGGKLYAIGGQFGHDCYGGEDQQYAHVYNPITDKWTELPNLPAPRSHAEGGVFTMDGKIYIVAGQSMWSNNTNKVTVFDPSGNNGSGSWTDDNTLTLPSSYEGISAKVIGSNIYYSHGGEGSSRNTRNTVYSNVMARRPLYRLSFSPDPANIKAVAGSSVKGKTYLFTYDANKNYSISSNASWLNVTQNQTGNAIPSAVEIEFTINTSGLAPGNYSALLNAAGTGSGQPYTPGSYAVNLTVDAVSPEISTVAESIFSGVKSVAGKIKPVVISNTGTAPLTITALNITGTNANAFRLVSPPAMPLNVAAGQTYTVNVQFTPPSTPIGALSASLNITNNDLDESALKVSLYGLSATGEQGNREPPLDGVVRTLGYLINVGGKALILSTGTAAIGEETLTPLFMKAGAGPVTMKPVARYSPDDLLAYGYYTNNNNTPVTTEIGKIALDQEQTLLPDITSGSATSFDPGNAVFGLFTGPTSYALQNTYTEDRYNTGPLKHSVRIYPLRDRAGKLIPNAYLVGFEPASNGDYQDYVFEVTNVKPATAAVPVTPTGVLEAEQAVLSGAKVASNRTGFTGSGFADFINNSNDYVEWTVNKPAAGSATLTFRYANGTTENRALRLEVNGQVVGNNMAFTGTGSWTSWSNSATVTTNLLAGVNKIRLVAVGFNGANIDHLNWTEAQSTVPQQGTLEAEVAVLNKVTVQSNRAGFTGSGFADFTNNTGDYVEWTINSSVSTAANLQFRYANGVTADRPLKLDVNGATIVNSLSFPPTGAWTTWTYVSVQANLAAGANSVRLSSAGLNGANLDHLKWESIEAGTSASVGISEENLVDKVVRIKVSPNPASSFARIHLQGLQKLPVEISVMDISGKIHRKISGNAAGGEYRYDLPVKGLPSGLYILLIRNGGKQYVTKIFKDKY